MPDVVAPGTGSCPPFRAGDSRHHVPAARRIRRFLRSGTSMATPLVAAVARSCARAWSRRHDKRSAALIRRC